MVRDLEVEVRTSDVSLQSTTMTVGLHRESGMRELRLRRLEAIIVRYITGLLTIVGMIGQRLPS